MTSEKFFFDFLITVVPLGVLGAGYYLFKRFSRRELSTAVRAGFGVMFTVLVLWGIYQLWYVNQGDGFSGLIMIPWVVYGVPVAVGGFFLVWSVVTLTRSRSTATRKGKTFAMGFVALAVVAGINYLYKDFQLGVSRNNNVEPERLRALYHSWYAGIEKNVSRNLALNKSTPVDVLQQLAVHDELWVRKNVCLNQSTPTSLLAVLAKDREWEIRQCVAGRPNTSAELLEQLANDPSESVRHGVAYGTNSTELLMKLSRDSSDRVRTTVAMNKNTPVAALIVMAADPHDTVRRLVAVRADLPLQQRLQLAEDESAEVRDALMDGGRTPIEVLNKLENDPVEKVRKSAQRRLLERKGSESNNR